MSIVTITNPESNGIAKEFQIFRKNLFRTLEPGEEIKIVTESDKEQLYYESLGDILGFNVGVQTDPEEPEEGSKVDVSDQTGLEEAISNPDVKSITIASEVALDKELQLRNSGTTFNGNNETISSNTEGKVLTFWNEGTTVNDLVIESTADNTDWHSSYNVQFYTGTHKLKNAKLSGGNAGIIVNAATLTLEGTIDVSGNTFGGIEVSKGAAEGLSAGVLNINGATLVNTTEEYGKPTIWIDGNTDDVGIVNGAESMTMIEKDGQKQYYLDASHAVDPDGSIKVGDISYDTLSDAVANANGAEIILGKDVSESINIPAGSTVVINGNGHKIHGTLDLKSGESGKGSVKVSNVIFDGEGNTVWALRSQNQTATAGQSSFDVEFNNCQFKNLTKKALYMTEISSLKVNDCTFENCATDEMNDPNTYGDYVIDCNLIGVKNVEVSIDGCTFSNNGAQKADIKVTQRGGESDEGATDMPQGVTASVDSFSVTGCTFNDDIVADVAIGTNNKSESTNPDAVNTTGNFGMVTISGNTTETVVSTPYDEKSYTVAVGQTFTKQNDQEPVINSDISETSYTKEELLSKSKSDIQSIASGLGLDTSGTKETIADRIVESYNA